MLQCSAAQDMREMKRREKDAAKEDVMRWGCSDILKMNLWRSGEIVSRKADFWEAPLCMIHDPMRLGIVRYYVEQRTIDVASKSWTKDELKRREREARERQMEKETIEKMIKVYCKTVFLSSYSGQSELCKLQGFSCQSVL